MARLWVQGHSKQQWSLQCICVSPHYRYDGEHNRNQMCSVQVMLSDLVQNCVHSKHSWKYWNSISRSEYWSSGLRYSCYSRSLAILYQLCEDWKDFAFNELRLSKRRSLVFKHSKWRDICSRISSFGESIRKTGTPYLSRPRVAFLHQPVMRLWLDMLLGKDSSHCQSHKYWFDLLIRRSSCSYHRVWLQFSFQLSLNWRGRLCCYLLNLDKYRLRYGLSSSSKPWCWILNAWNSWS